MLVPRRRLILRAPCSLRLLALLLLLLLLLLLPLLLRRRLMQWRGWIRFAHEFEHAPLHDGRGEQRGQRGAVVGILDDHVREEHVQPMHVTPTGHRRPA